MHQLIDAAGTNGIEHKASGGEIVTLELSIVDATDLRLQHHDSIGLREMRLPGAGLSQIHAFGQHIWVHATQCLDIGAMLVEHDDIGIALRLETCDEILANEPGTAGQDDFLIFQGMHSDVQTIENKTRQMTDDHHNQRPARRRIHHGAALGDCRDDHPRHRLR